DEARHIGLVLIYPLISTSTSMSLFIQGWGQGVFSFGTTEKPYGPHSKPPRQRELKMFGGPTRGMLAMVCMDHPTALSKVVT
ncbi:hypothetical protein AB4Z52_04165, partial [Rhizobium sp. 2YAF20]|uniref:hypothetical protein n=1 Tax=Rhizobium sp. 2YAF20 TaxID=3233027 RepID=UPI003F963671